MGLYVYGVLVVMEDLEQIILLNKMLQSPHLPEETIGNRFLVEDFIQEQLKLMGLYGLGDLIVVVPPEHLETILSQTETLQSPHLPAERIGNQFLVQVIIQQQSKLMGLYGLGVMVVMGDLEQIILQPEALRSPHLPAERIGNQLLGEGILRQQSKPMGLYGYGVLVVMEDLEQIILLNKMLQSPHLPEETIGNRLLVDLITQQQSKPMVVSGFGVKIVITDNLEQITSYPEVLQSPHLPEETIGNLLPVGKVTQ
jgi:hypothetical protein